jgi:hypothetical protein
LLGQIPARTGSPRSNLEEPSETVLETASNYLILIPSGVLFIREDGLSTFELSPDELPDAPVQLDIDLGTICGAANVSSAPMNRLAAIKVADWMITHSQLPIIGGRATTSPDCFNSVLKRSVALRAALLITITT